MSALKYSVRSKRLRRLQVLRPLRSAPSFDCSNTSSGVGTSESLLPQVAEFFTPSMKVLRSLVAATRRERGTRDIFHRKEKVSTAPSLSSWWQSFFLPGDVLTFPSCMVSILFREATKKNSPIELPTLHSTHSRSTLEISLTFIVCHFSKDPPTALVQQFHLIICKSLTSFLTDRVSSPLKRYHLRQQSLRLLILSLGSTMRPLSSLTALCYLNTAALLRFTAKPPMLCMKRRERQQALVGCVRGRSVDVGGRCVF